jgi:hypothetical protein
MKIEFNQFLGANSDVNPNLLTNNYAVEATNVFTDQGILSTWKSLKQVTPWNTKTGTLNHLFLMNNALWLAWGEVTSSAPLQLATNTEWNTAFTNSTIGPQYTNLSLAVAGGGMAYPTTYRPLGVPKPTSALVATVNLKATPANSMASFWNIAGTVADTIGNRITRAYVYTYVNTQGREGPPSDASNFAYTNDDEFVRLTNFTAAPNADITKMRIYVAASGGTFNFLKEILFSDLTGSPLHNDITDNAFGAAITTTLYSPPPTALKGLVAMANGILAGYVGNNLYFSEPYQSHAWPEDYIKAMDYPIKGLAAIGNMLYVSTEGYPVIVTGNSPAFMTDNKLGAVPASVSDRSMVTMGLGYTSANTLSNLGASAMYASKDGIVMMTSGAATMVSDGIISERVYQLMNPTSIHAYFYRNKYFGFYDSGSTGSLTASTGEIIPAKGGFILDPSRKTVTYTDVWCEVAFSDKASGKLYLAIKQGDNSNNLYEWNEGATNLTQYWKAKPTKTEPITFAAARVWADRYPVTFQLYADEVLKHTKTVSSVEPFRLPSGFRAREWSPRVYGDSDINAIYLSTSMMELMQ